MKRLRSAVRDVECGRLGPVDEGSLHWNFSATDHLNRAPTDSLMGKNRSII